MSPHGHNTGILHISILASFFQFCYFVLNSALNKRTPNCLEAFLFCESSILYFRLSTNYVTESVYFTRYELFSTLFGQVQTDDRQKATHMSPPWQLHRWVQKLLARSLIVASHAWLSLASLAYYNFRMPSVSFASPLLFTYRYTM